MKKILKQAFSLVELMVTLIVISCIMAALVPSITKKLKSQGITVGSGGGGGGGDSSVSTDCGGLFNDDCKLCNINFCLQCDKSCSEGYYKNISRCNCASCTTYNPNCATCDSIGCLSCVEGYRYENGECILTTVTKEFTTAGEHQFTVPSGVSELTVTLISGGAGGAGGIDTIRNETFVTQGNGDVTTEDDDNILHVKNTGIITWTIPKAIRGKEVTINACGGGGGGGWNSSARGGDGGAIREVAFTLPDWENIKIHIGGGGGGPSEDATCSLAGWGTGKNNPSCNADTTTRYGAGGVSNSVRTGGDGYDPIYGNHGVGGGTGGTGGFSNIACSHSGGSGKSGNGSLVGGGGGALTWMTSHSGATSFSGGGGGATLFFHEEYANVADIVAPGGGGGGHWTQNKWGSCGYYSWAYGGGGGGIGGGNGTNGTGGNGVGYDQTIFSENYCKGGASEGAGKPGAMRISYPLKSAASGGGGGQIVPNQKITVTPGDVLTITVGAGGAGGDVGKAGTSDPTMVSQITNSAGGVLISTKVAQNPTGGDTYGETAGTAGKFTNGQGNEVGAIDNWIISDGALPSGDSGGDGGMTKINGATFCSGGVGGNATEGGNALGYGGCGGGGGAPGFAGGAGASGYVKVTWGGS